MSLAAVRAALGPTTDVLFRANVYAHNALHVLTELLRDHPYSPRQ